jgi:glyoxalase family protein
VVDATEHRPGDIPAEHAIRGLAGVTISLGGLDRTASLLTDLLGFRLTAEEGGRIRFEIGEAGLGRRIELLNEPELEQGIGGIGAVHHVALRADTDEKQQESRQLLQDAGYDVSPILDRMYFRSIYFRDHDGVLFEIATDSPGFAVDEPYDSLGELLMLPPWLEPRRVSIEARLPVLRSSRKV